MFGHDLARQLHLCVDYTWMTRLVNRYGMRPEDTGLSHIETMGFYLPKTSLPLSIIGLFHGIHLDMSQKQ